MVSTPMIVVGPRWADALVDGVGWLLLSVGVLMRLWATLYIGGRKGVTIVTDGPYSLCRNPLYLGSMLCTLAMAVFLRSLLVLSAVTVSSLVYVLWVIPREERFLAAAAGEPYLEYRRRTPRLLPFGRLHSAFTVEIWSGPFQRELRCALVWLLGGLLVNTAAHLRALDWWPQLLRLP
jgi:protein-S-isoprenylcysteine O-methyltransferase Ste14